LLHKLRRPRLRVLWLIFAAIADLSLPKLSDLMARLQSYLPASGIGFLAAAT
jgi:hypothetical protein